MLVLVVKVCTCPTHVVVVRSHMMLFEFLHVEGIVVIGYA